MAKKTKSPKPPKVKKQPVPLLDEKRPFFANLTANLPKLRGGFILQQAKNDLVSFGKISLFIAPVIFVLSCALVGTDMLLHGRVMPGISAGNSPIGFLYSDDAANVLQQKADEYLNTPISVSVNGAQTQVTPQELGVRFSLPQTLLSVPVYDFRKNSVISLAFAALNQHQAAPFMILNSRAAQNAIEAKLNLQKVRAQSASISFDAKKNPVIVPESAGEVLDKNELMSQLQQSIKDLKPTPIKLSLIAEKPLITAQELTGQKDAASSALKSTVTLVYNDRKWKFDPSKHLDAVSFTSNPSITFKNIHLTLPIVLNSNQTVEPTDNVVMNTTPAITLDEQKIKDFLQNEIIAKIDHPTSDVKISTDANKKIVIDGKGQNGIKVSPPALLASLDLAMSTNTHQIKVPALEEKAKVSVSPDLQNLGIKNLIATGHTVFAGSHPGRIKNINVGMSTYNGLLVQPGEIFSFDDHLGPVDGQHGYVEELVIKGNQGTVPDFGGGLCQVSSTIYQAALLAGFPILERANHSYAVSYYAKPLGYGLDATIYPGVHDVKFKNDSPSAILIQSYTEDGQAYFKFYGTEDGRKVWLEGPYQSNYRAAAAPQTITTNTLAPGVKKQVEIPHTGFDVTWYRHIVENGKETKEKLFTRYDNTGAEILVGAGTPATAVTAAVPKS